MKKIYIGTAGWQLPPEFKTKGPGGLEQYARLFNCVEINSSFYRQHKKATYERWAQTVPAGFRFSVKLAKTITHEKKLKSVSADIKEFLQPVNGLGKKLGCILVQLPPGLKFSKPLAEKFFRDLRRHYRGPVKLEARHPSWSEAGSTLKKFSVDGVYADPVRVGLVLPATSSYLRLHGSPKIYKSSYSNRALLEFAELIASSKKKTAVWCIFDNTMYGFAARNALKLMELTAGPNSTK